MSTTAGRWESFGDSLKLTEVELQSLLQIRQKTQGRRGDARSGPGLENTRACRRVCVTGASWVPAEFREAGGGTWRVRAYPVDLSASGMCLLTDRFVHKGTACALTLSLRDGELISLNAKVVRCELLQGRAHEVGLEFHEPMDLGLVTGPIESSALSPVGAGTTSGARAEKPAVATLARAAKELRTIAERMATLGADAGRLTSISADLEPMSSAG